MNYNVKLTKEAIEQLKALIGFNAEQINVSRGLIKVTSVEAVNQVAGMFAVENVNFKPYDEFVKEAEAVKQEEKPEPKPVKNFSLKERKEIIGDAFEPGCIVHVKIEDLMEHAVIISVNGSSYVAARIVLKDFKKADDNRIPLRKDLDVIYRNPTYKPVVTIVNEVAYDLEEDDFMKDSGGAILGRVVNQEILDRLLLWDYSKEEEEPATVDPVSFEETVKRCNSVEDIINSLWLEEYDLAVLAREAVNRNSRNMKALLPVMKTYMTDLTQPQIKESLESQVEDWSKTMVVEMQECTLPYFLKVIMEQVNAK